MQREPIDYPADALPTRDDHVRTADGWTLPVTVTSPGLGAHGTVVICSALGVPRRFYAAFARALCLAGWRVVTFDYRGIGEAAATGPGTPRFADWGRHDIDAVLKWVHDTLVPEGLAAAAGWWCSATARAGNWRGWRRISCTPMRWCTWRCRWRMRGSGRGAGC